MKQILGTSSSGDVREAVRGIDSPDMLIMISDEGSFEKNVAALHDIYPEVPCIASTGYFYTDRSLTSGVGVSAFFGVDAVTGAVHNVSSAPVSDIVSFDKNSSGFSGGDSVCIDFCTGNDAVVLTTMRSVLKRRGIPLTGGTGMHRKVAVNGQVCEDTDVYAFIRNKGGKVRVYKENLYRPMEGTRFIASKTDKSRYYIGELNGRPAKIVYEELTGATDDEISNRTFRNPLGRVTGSDISIVSLREIMGNGLCCYRQVNDSDVLNLLELKDVREIVSETVGRIKSDFSSVSAIFSVNCIFRHELFEETGFTNEYLGIMSSLGNSYCGFVGNGEHYCDQFLNQSMSCAVFG
jgi:hypothetical protein